MLSISKIKIIGDLKKIPLNLIKKLKKVEQLSKHNLRLQINVALNYGSRQEIINALRKIKFKRTKITEKLISQNLYTKNIPDPDILIRTGNTRRLSNFLLWQLEYTEIFLKKNFGQILVKTIFIILSKSIKKLKEILVD